MGAWGAGNFDNDAVLDWLPELKGWSSVLEALQRVLQPTAGKRAGVNACCIALGAAEVVAACLGRPGRAPDDVMRWAHANREGCDERARALANACVRRIDSASELQELFDEDGRNDDWHAHLDDLLQRLAV